MMYKYFLPVCGWKFLILVKFNFIISLQVYVRHLWLTQDHKDFLQMFFLCRVLVSALTFKLITHFGWVSFHIWYEVKSWGFFLCRASTFLTSFIGKTIISWLNYFGILLRTYGCGGLFLDFSILFHCFVYLLHQCQTILVNVASVSLEIR